MTFGRRVADRMRWAAYGACVCTSAYGTMKLAQALGSDVLVRQAPMRPDLRVHLLAHDPWFVAGDWLLFAVAILGVLIALATVRPWGRPVPRWFLLIVSWPVGVFMVLRSIGPVGFGFLGDTLVLSGAQQVPAPARHADLSHYLAVWDLTLWSPFFMIWGLLWLAVAWRVTRAGRAAVVGIGV